MKIVLSTGETAEVHFDDSDGEVCVEFAEDAIRVSTDWPDTSGRTGIIYEERFGADLDDEHGALLRGETRLGDHILYETGDAGAPDVVRDANGDVVLAMCKRCGKVEVDLNGPCDPRLRLKVLEVNTSIDGKEGVDFLIVDEAAKTPEILKGADGIYCQVATRLTADTFVKAVNEYPEVMDALEASVAEVARLREAARAKAVINNPDLMKEARQGLNAAPRPFTDIESDPDGLSAFIVAYADWYFQSRGDLLSKLEA